MILSSEDVWASFTGLTCRENIKLILTSILLLLGLFLIVFKLLCTGEWMLVDKCLGLALVNRFSKNEVYKCLIYWGTGTVNLELWSEQRPVSKQSPLRISHEYEVRCISKMWIGIEKQLRIINLQLSMLIIVVLKLNWCCCKIEVGFHELISCSGTAGINRE